MATGGYFRQLHYYLALCSLIIAQASAQADVGICGLFDAKRTVNRNDPEKCNPTKEITREEAHGEADHYHNIPILTAVYCFNNGTGICKVLSGRFEFYMNSWTQQYLGPVGPSQYVDSNGYHERVPISYTINGSVLTADRVINWANWFTNTSKTEYSLLSATSFNWCKFAISDNWPYKSSILDHDKTTRIYFFNRQSCIFNPKTGDIQHYNTRFLHKSKLRIDLDYNPTIWAMEDDLAGHEVFLVKHVRQHYKEMKWTLLTNPKQGIKYFVKMEEINETIPKRIDGKGPFIRYNFYENYTDLCVNDHYSKHKDGNNSYSVPVFCGSDSFEIAVFGKAKRGTHKFLYEVSLHGIPRHPPITDNFYDVKTYAEEDWERWAGDGYSFSATTTIPVDEEGEVFEVISLFSEYKGEPSDEYDEHYPHTYLLRYNMSFRNELWEKGHDLRKKLPKEKNLNLNYVDDIAYLPICSTILVIFGPLYTEYPVGNFSVHTKTPLGSIYKLGLNEMVTAFFAWEDKVYFYHRLNFIAEHKYTCGRTQNELVTAKRVGDYYFRAGKNYLPLLRNDTSGGPWTGINIDRTNNHQEEKLFKDLGIFKGDLSKREAPNAIRYPWSPNDDKEPTKKSFPWWIWLLVGGGVLFLMILFILGLTIYRRRRRRRYLAETQRSEMPSIMSGASTRSVRSSMRTDGASTATMRSGLPSGNGMTPSEVSGGSTTRSSRLEPRVTDGAQRNGILSRSLGSSPARRASSGKPLPPVEESGSGVNASSRPKNSSSSYKRGRKFRRSRRR